MPSGSFTPCWRGSTRCPTSSSIPRHSGTRGSTVSPRSWLRVRTAFWPAWPGSPTPDWLRRQLRAGARGDLGVRRPTVAVGEPDLIAELQRRLAALDLGALREAAIGRYWQRAALVSLPTATQARERTVDPTVTASADLVLPDGTPLVRAGQTVNPLELLPFMQRLIVFDASDPDQVETARRLGEAPGRCARSTRRPVWIETRARAGRAFARRRGTSGGAGLPADLRRAPALRLGARAGRGRGARASVRHHRGAAAVRAPTHVLHTSALVLGLLAALLASSPQAEDAGCPDAKLLSGKLITDICWACLFPVRLFGLNIAGDERPSGASNNVFCACPDTLGRTAPRAAVGLWEPARIVELTAAPDLLPRPRRASACRWGSRACSGPRARAPTTPTTSPSTTITGTPSRC